MSVRLLVLVSLYARRSFIVILHLFLLLFPFVMFYDANLAARGRWTEIGIPLCYTRASNT